MTKGDFTLDDKKLMGVAKQFGTPVWLYNQETIEKRISQLKSFDVVRYAQKANSNMALLNLMKQNEVLVDAVSAGEVERALRTGFDPSAKHPGVVYTADLFDDDALEIVKNNNITVNIGSPDMLDQLKAENIDTDIILRINPGFGHGHSKKVNTGGDLSKHGIWHEQLSEVLAYGKKLGLNIMGLHMHIGSGSDFEHLSEVCHAMVAAAKVFGSNLKVISAGGGLPIPYHKENAQYIDVDKYYELWDNARKKIEGFVGHEVHLEVEPGRFLVAESGYLITRICSIKQMGDNWFYLVDAGFNDLVRPSFYGSYHHISIVAGDGRDLGDETCDVVVAGPLCESCDVFTQEEGGFVSTRKLAKAKVGDYLILHDVGAYGFAMSSNYNSRRFPAEVLLNKNEIYLIRERQSFDQLFQLEKVPEYLK